MNYSAPKFWLVPLTVLFTFLPFSSGLGQIVPDRTLNSLVIDRDNIIQIDGGNRPENGNNLFHSFREFSVTTGKTAFFNNALDIQNIFTRVTGNSISNIDGLIKANGAANLFIINPNGIIFGKNTSLNIGGSFFATTAEKIKFADNSEFSSRITETEPLLAITIPIGLGFGESPGKIVDRSMLQVPLGATLALLGGEVLLDGGNLIAEGGRIELGSVAGNNSVKLAQTNQGWTLDYQGISNFQNLNLLNALVDSSGNRGGEIQLQGKQLTFTDSIVGATTFGLETGGNLSIKASDSIDLKGNSLLFTENINNGITGNLTIESKNLIVEDNGFITTQGQGGNLTVIASESTKLIGQTTETSASGILTLAPIETRERGGTITVETGKLIVKNGSIISAITIGLGKAGDIKVKTSESVELLGRAADYRFASGIFAQSLSEDFPGDSGKITIETGRLILTDGAKLSVATFGTGNAGDLQIKATESVELRGFLDTPEGRVFSGISTGVQEGSTGNAGNLSIDTQRLIVLDGGTIDSVTRGVGKAGSVLINATDSIFLSGAFPGPEFLVRSGIFVSAQPESTGNAGELKLNTEELIVEKKAKIGVDNFGKAKGGSATLNVNNLIIRDGGEVTVSATGEGQAGSLRVKANSILLDNTGSLQAQTRVGNQGNIILDARNILLRGESNITTNASEEATGGNITIDTDILTSLENSEIAANAVRGRGGNIQITTQGIFLSPDSKITASSDFGIDGTVFLNTPEVDPTSGLVKLPSTVIDAEDILAQDLCKFEDDKIAGGSSFIITGKGGLPPSSDDPLVNSYRIVEWITRSEQQDSLSAKQPLNDLPKTDETKIAPAIEEAQGWIIKPNGKISLVAVSVKATPQSFGLVHPQCR